MVDNMKLSRIGQVLLTVVVLLLVFTSVASVILFASTNNIQNREKLRQEQNMVYIDRVIANACGFFGLLGTAPLISSSSKIPVTKLATELVIDSRNTAWGLGCPTLPAPTINLIFWASKYNIPVKH